MEKQNSNTSELDRLATEYGTDKGPSYHHYTKWYHHYLNDLRKDPVTLLELGWGGHEDPDRGGSSAQMWRDYFPNGTVVVIDIEEKTITDAHRGINFRRGSQSDSEFLTEIHKEFGDFDIVIDDASHLSSLTIESFKLLFPFIKRGGLYFCEDTHLAYHDFYYGKDEANRNPRKARSNGQPTAMQFFQQLTDEVNFKGRDESDWDLFPKKYSLGYPLEWAHFYFNLFAAKKR